MRVKGENGGMRRGAKKESTQEQDQEQKRYRSRPGMKEERGEHMNTSLENRKANNKNTGGEERWRVVWIALVLTRMSHRGSWAGRSVPWGTRA